MGNSKSNTAVKESKLVSVTTDTLKARLNKFYDARINRDASQEGLFEYLWDLKELALMEGRAEVQVPATWLEDLEDTSTSSRTH